MRKIALLSLVSTAALMASGYRIPESSVNATALADAYVANANGADATYYNPANMVFSDNKGGALEVDLTYIGLSPVDYKSTDKTIDVSSKAENFAVPTFHYVSPAVDNFRFGLSVVSSAGLSKRWSEAPASTTTKEFTLQTVEINPTVAYKLNDQLAVAFGVRGLYSSGVVENAYYDMKGTGFDWGYNFAVTLKPTKSTNVALTYRSQIDLHVKGDATNVLNATASGRVNSGGKVSLPLPAMICLAASHTFNDTTTVEAVLEHNVWSAYDKLDFDFSNTNVYSVLEAAKQKNWQDTDTVRIGLTHKYEKTTAMVGFSYDPSPTPNATVGYELPDSDGKIVSLGGRYDITDSINVGLAGLVSFKDDRNVANNDNGLTGKFTNSRAYLVTAGLEYKF